MNAVPNRLFYFIALSLVLIIVQGCPSPSLPDDDTVLESSGPRQILGGTPLDVTLSDGSWLYQSSLPTQGNLTRITFDRISSNIDLRAADVEAINTTSVRVLRFDSFDPVEKGIKASSVTPIIGFPASSLASVERETVAVVRIADLFIDGRVIRNHISTLPVTFTNTGGIMATDIFFPDSILSDLAYTAAKNDSEILKQGRIYPREIRYVVSTFQGSYNWRISPVLRRFYPNGSSAAKRLDWNQLTAEQQNRESKKHIKNILVLVHGHNEEEKLGDATSTAPAPWYFGYKRDVWTLFYSYLLETNSDVLNCTAFYEFIYPTYKPIFTPHRPNQRTDEHFANAINSLLQGHLSDDPDTQLFIVGHSQGGLVARAGIQLFNTATHQAFRKLVTWGTPHMGSPLVSLRYVLGAPGGIYQAGPEGVVNFPLGNIDHTLFALRRAVDNIQVDAPGTRDLRWANSHTTTPYNLALDQLFSFDVDSAVDPWLWNMYDLYTGTEIYSENLRKLNAEDTYRLSNKYHALYGVTSKRARIEFPLLRWFLPTIVGGDTALGALVMPWLVQNPTQTYEGRTLGSSDGAVPVVSMAGAGITGLRRDLGDIDHEEYFGAPKPHGQFRADHLAWTTARETIVALGIPACPAPQPPGTRIFTINQQDEYVLNSYRGSFIDLRLQRAATMEIEVNFDGQSEPSIRQDSWEPENVWNVVVQGYKNPVTVRGTYNITISHQSFQAQHTNKPGPSEYTLKRIEYEHVKNGTVQIPVTKENDWAPPGSSYTSVFTVPVNPVTDPNFPNSLRFTDAIGRIRLIWDVVDYNQSGAVISGPYEYIDIPNVPSVILVNYLLWIK